MMLAMYTVHGTVFASIIPRETNGEALSLKRGFEMLPVASLAVHCRWRDGVDKNTALKNDAVTCASAASGK